VCSSDLWAEKQRAAGRIGHVGFSFHDECAVFKQIVDDYDWTVGMIQYNYMDVANQAGREGLQHAAAKGLAVVVMEPLAGGRLVRPPRSVQTLWDAAPKKRTPIEWALHWIWSQPEVSVVLSGMSALPQVEENLAVADQSAVGLLAEPELELIAAVRREYQRLCPIPCTQCGYCLPCPHGVNIPRNFRIYNDGAMYGDTQTARNWYGAWLEQAERAGACTQCHECEAKCPQHIPIADWMPRVHQTLGEAKPGSA
jgi:predicted aldo/keto reductase-like oxidoreductase